MTLNQLILIFVDLSQLYNPLVVTLLPDCYRYSFCKVRLVCAGGAGVSAAEGKEQIDQLDADQAAKLFEASLASGLVADDGQLALLQLFKSNVDSTVPQLLRNFMSMAPQGQVGQIRCVTILEP